MNELEEGTILRPDSRSGWFIVALKVTSFEWTITGEEHTMKPEGLFNYSGCWTKVGYVDPKTLYTNTSYPPHSMY